MGAREQAVAGPKKGNLRANTVAASDESQRILEKGKGVLLQKNHSKANPVCGSRHTRFAGLLGQGISKKGKPKSGGNISIRAGQLALGEASSTHEVHILTRAQKSIPLRGAQLKHKEKCDGGLKSDSLVTVPVKLLMDPPIAHTAPSKRKQSEPCQSSSSVEEQNKRHAVPPPATVELSSTGYYQV